jgi:SAM-dependent methyltransferase
VRSTATVHERAYPEVGAGGFSHVDGTISFYGRIDALLRPDMVVLDYGAGRGEAALDDPVPYRRRLRVLKGKVAKVIGVDVDPVVVTNPSVDEAIVVAPDAPLPLADGSVDLIVSDSTFEHVTDPAFVASELSRVLKRGGWLCARTPNRWGYASVGARLVPNRLHARVLRWLQPHRKEEDVFPTVYRMNTRRALRKLFPQGEFDHFVYTMNSEPAYFGRSILMWRSMMLAFRLIPSGLGATFFVFLRKK